MRNKILLLFSTFLVFTLSSCEDYVTVIPTGQKVPQSVSDFDDLMEHENMLLYPRYKMDMIVGEYFLNFTRYAVNSPADVQVNWKSDIDRIPQLQTDQMYEDQYKRISNLNYILDEGGKATPEDEEDQLLKTQMLASARILRAYSYYDLVNIYAKSYNPATADSDLSVVMPLVSGFEADLTQRTVKEAYDLMISDALDAVEDLPEIAISVVRPNKAFGYGFIARLYAHTQQYDLALQYANKSLALNSELFDWVQYWDDSKDLEYYQRPAMGLENPENLLFAMSSQWGVSNVITGYRAAQYEPGDVRYVANFTYFKYYPGINLKYKNRRDKDNSAGLRTPHILLLRAELHARNGDFDLAMADVNKLRKTRIYGTQVLCTAGLPMYDIDGKPIVDADDNLVLSDGTELKYNKYGMPVLEKQEYTNISASNIKDIMEIILKERASEFYGSGERFFDLKRLNVDPNFEVELTNHDYEGNEIHLLPESNLWVFPFALVATSKNSDLQQNSF